VLAAIVKQAARGLRYFLIDSTKKTDIGYYFTELENDSKVRVVLENVEEPFIRRIYQVKIERSEVEHKELIRVEFHVPDGTIKNVNELDAR